jgi:glucan 1,3-beta-glucosidase
MLILNFIMIANSLEKINGVNIGGWLVLEPWITPSLFYNSFGLEDKFPIDTYTFCDYYEPEVSNQIFQSHISNWVKETDIKYLAESGVNLLRVPIGDWIFEQYGPYEKKSVNNIKCLSGSEEKIDWIFSIGKKYNLEILLDLHAIKGSQNGFDNSGQSLNINIQSNKYTHRDIRTANWLGPYNLETKQYDFINQSAIEYSVKLLEKIIIKYSDNDKYSNLYGIEVLNEPWEKTPEDVLKDFYQQVYNIFIQHMDKNKTFVIHDSFRSDIWENFSFEKNVNPVVIDTHQYTAWYQPYKSFDNLVNSGYSWQKPKSQYPYIIGEFSLAIDNCEMWLNGFMDNLDGYPLFECVYKSCPFSNIISYTNLIAKSINGPFGSGISYPNPYIYKCPTSIDFLTHFNNDENFISYDEVDMAKKVFYSKVIPYQNHTNGWIFWNFKTESDNYHWNLIKFINLTQINFNDIDIDIDIYSQSTNKYNDYYINYDKLIGTIVLCISIFSIGICYYLYNRKNYKKYNKFTYVSINHFNEINYNQNNKILDYNEPKKYKYSTFE